MDDRETLMEKFVKGVQERYEHPYHMYENIMGTPGLLQSCISASYLDPIRETAKLIVKRKIKKIFLSGCRTSLFSGEIIGFGFDQLLGIPYSADDPFETLVYPPSDLDKDSAFVIISSSGNTPLFQRVAELAKEKGALVVVITENPDAKLIPLADSTIIGPGGIDPLVSKTRSFGTALIRGFMLIALISDLLFCNEISDTVHSLPGISEQSLRDNEKYIRELVDKWGDVSKYLSAGVGPNIWTAEEIALTMTKTNGKPSFGFEIEEFCHGPELMLNSTTGVFLYQSGEVGIEKTLVAAKAVIAAGAKLAVITNNRDAEWPDEAAIIKVPKSEDLFSPLIMILPAQLFIYYTALKLGRNPDIGGIVDNPKITEVIKILHSSRNS